MLNKQTVGQHGGKRKGAGRPPGIKGTNHKANGDPYFILAKAKAKRESYKAVLTEIEYKQKTGELYEKDEVIRVVSTAFNAIVQSLRSLPDNIERTTGCSPEIVQAIEEMIDNETEALASRLSKLGKVK